MKKVSRIIRISLGFILTLFLFTGALLLINYPTEYLRRLIAYGTSDVYDYQIFPERAVAPAPQPYSFRQSTDPDRDLARVKAAFEQNELVGADLEAFLEGTGTQALIVIQNDAILSEQYFNGARRDSIVTSFSAAKSFVSTLVGIAEAEGKINSIDDPITRYLPELAARDPRFENITIRHLLDMSSGIKYVENGFVNGDDALTYYYPDLRVLALHTTLIAEEPGQTWLYNNYHPLLLGIILERATGVSVAAYLEQKIWQPIGAEYPASWSLDSAETGFEKMESGINARAIDFAKLGRLYLNQGLVTGVQVLPAEWVQAATRMDPAIDRPAYYPESMDQPNGRFYHQRLWWGLQRESGAYGFAAQGNFGQEIFVYPARQIIIVRNGERYGIQPQEWMKLFMDFSEWIVD